MPDKPGGEDWTDEEWDTSCEFCNDVLPHCECGKKRPIRYPNMTGGLCGVCGELPCKCQEHAGYVLRSELSSGAGELAREDIKEDNAQVRDEVYEEGHGAFVLGKKAIDNPYMDWLGRPMMQRWWQAGWLDAMWESLKETTDVRVVNPGTQSRGRKIDVGG